MNITLPAQLAARVKAAENGSALIADSLREKFEREEKDQLNLILQKTYRQANAENKADNDSWDGVSGDGLY